MHPRSGRGYNFSFLDAIQFPKSFYIQLQHTVLYLHIVALPNQTRGNVHHVTKELLIGTSDTQSIASVL